MPSSYQGVSATVLSKQFALIINLHLLYFDIKTSYVCLFCFNYRLIICSNSSTVHFNGVSYMELHICNFTLGLGIG